MNILRVVEWWKAKVIVDMAGCGDAVFIPFDPNDRSAGGGQGGYLCQYFDRNLQGGEEGRMGLIHAEFGRCTH